MAKKKNVADQRVDSWTTAWPEDGPYDENEIARLAMDLGIDEDALIESLLSIAHQFKAATIVDSAKPSWKEAVDRVQEISTTARYLADLLEKSGPKVLGSLQMDKLEHLTECIQMLAASAATAHDELQEEKPTHNAKKKTEWFLISLASLELEKLFGTPASAADENFLTLVDFAAGPFGIWEPGDVPLRTVQRVLQNRKKSRQTD